MTSVPAASTSAAASGASRFVPALALAPVLERIRDSLAKVHADKGPVFTLDCAPALAVDGGRRDAAAA